MNKKPKKPMNNFLLICLAICLLIVGLICQIERLSDELSEFKEGFSVREQINVKMSIPDAALRKIIRETVAEMNKAAGETKPQQPLTGKDDK